MQLYCEISSVEERERTFVKMIIKIEEHMHSLKMGNAERSTFTKLNDLFEKRFLSKFKKTSLFVFFPLSLTPCSLLFLL